MCYKNIFISLIKNEADIYGKNSLEILLTIFLIYHTVNLY